MRKLTVLNQPDQTRESTRQRRETVGFLSGEKSPETPEEEPVEQPVARRPQSLRKTPEGGSMRLNALTDMLRTYSVVDDYPNRRESTARSSSDATLSELNRLQYLLGTELPNISSITLPSRLSDLLVPRKTLEDIEAYLNASSNSSNEELTGNWRQSEQIRMHDFVREMALKKLESDTFRQLVITYNNHTALMKSHEDGNAPPVSPFGWTLQDFIKRRQERNINWLEALLLRSEKDLEMLKFKCDMEELFKLLKLIFRGLRPSVSQIARQELFAFVHDAHEFLKFAHVFKVDAKTNMEKLREQVNTYLDMWFYKRGADEEAYKHNLEQKLMNVAVVGPIELRYQVGWMRTKTDQALLKMNNVIVDMEKKAESFRAEESKESYCARCALDMYYLDIERFKRRITILSAQYDTEFEKAENEIAYKKISMDKLRSQRKYLEEQMVRFKEEIEQMRQKEVEEQEAEEQRKQQKEQMLLEEQQAKKKKKPAKPKGKKK